MTRRRGNGAGVGGPRKGAGRGSPRHPAFEAGNLVSLTHGARSPRQVSARADELVAGLLADRPDLAAFPEAVAAWARAEARCALLDEWITARGLLDEDGEPTTGAVKYLSSWEAQAATSRARLGLDPRAEAELASVRLDARRSAVDLDAIRARGVASLAERAELPSGAQAAADDAGEPDVPGGPT